MSVLNSSVIRNRSKIYVLRLRWKILAIAKRLSIKRFQELQEAFDQESRDSGKPRLLLTIAVAAGLEKIQAGYDIPNIAQYIDFLDLMSYDYHGAWEDFTGLVAPLYSRPDDDDKWKTWNVNFSANYWASMGMPKEKIVIGIPFYGRGWQLTNLAVHGVNASASGPSPQYPYTLQDGVAAYYEVIIDYSWNILGIA